MEKDNVRYNMSNVEWDKYSNDSINFMFEQGNKLIVENLSAFREMTTKSYAALTIFLGFITYAIKELKFCPLMNIPYYVLILGLGLSCVFISLNLFPKIQGKTGTLPADLIRPFYSEMIDKSNQIRQQKISVIRGMNMSIISGNKIGIKRNVNYKYAIIIALITFSVFTLLSFYFN